MHTKDVNGLQSETKDRSVTFEGADWSCIHKTMDQIRDQRSKPTQDLFF